MTLLKNKQKAKEYERKRRKTQHRKDWTKNWKKKPKAKYLNYKDNARERKISFSLTLEQFKTFWQKPCYYCKEEIETIGLDRIDNNKGYVLENCVSCCKTCNFMKGRLSDKYFIVKCKQIAKHFVRRDNAYEKK